MKAPFLSSLLLLCFLIIGGCASHDETSKPQDFVGLSGKHAEEAEMAFAKAYVLWHGYRPSHLQNSRACVNPAKAVELLSEAIAHSQDFHEAFAYRARAYKDLEQYDKAFADINTALRSHTTPDYLALRASISLLQKHLVLAQQDIDEVFGLDDEHAIAWLYQGELYQVRGEQKLACKSFTTACSYGECSGLQKAQANGYCPHND